MTDLLDIPAAVFPYPTREQLCELSKMQLVELHQAATGKRGDYDRTPAADYLDRITHACNADGVTFWDEAARERVARAFASLRNPTEEPAPMPAPARRPVVIDQPAPAPVAPVPEDAARQLLGIVQGLAGAALNEDRVRAIVADAVAELEARMKPETREVRIYVTPRAEVRMEGRQHPAFAEALDAMTAGLNVLLVGPAGCGKTHLMRDLARAVAAERVSITSGSAGASESHLSGWLLPIAEGGRFAYVPAGFVNVYERGGLAGLDELDAYDPNMLLMANAALANGAFTIPQRYEAPEVQRHPDCYIVSTANTYGTGADAVYVGRNQLDAATLDRFYVIPMDYDTDYEATLAPAEVCEWVWGIRRKITELRLRRVMSTRAIQKAALLMGKGRDFDSIKPRLLAGWTRDELAKVGV